jgi:signal transduction histidine kinase
VGELAPELPALSALVRAINDAHERLQKTQDLLDATLTHTSLDGLFEDLLVGVRDLLHADTCAILLLDDASNELVARAAKGLEEEVERGVRIPVGKGFAGRIVASRRPLALDQVDHSNVLNPILREKGVKSLLGAPLMTRDRTLGVIHAGTLHPRKFTDEEAELLLFVAQRIALGIERVQVQEDLVRLDRTKSDFIAVASHELRNPVTVVRGIAETLHRRSADLTPDEETELKETLYAETVGLAELVGQLLDLSRLDANAIRVHPRRFSVRERVEGLLLAAAGDGATDVQVQVPLELEAVVDPDVFDRVLSNLIANAVRYGSPPVTVAAEQRDSHLRVTVEDRGTGIPKDFVEHLFDRFSRTPESAAGDGGAGLGLAIAQSFASAHGGCVVYEAAEPRGARFQLVLPLRDDEG